MHDMNRPIRAARTLRYSIPLVVSAFGTAAFAGPVPDYDFQWATITHAGNAPYLWPEPGSPEPVPAGSVGYEFRISRLEVTTSQWMEFVNTFSTQSDELRFFGEPTFWGAGPDPTYEGPGMRWRLGGSPDAGMRPVSGITWREAAQFTNWLHNDKGSNLSAIAAGAYDTSTFSTNPDGTFNDQLVRSPGAKFWIPSLDEWIKAAHFDPDRHGPEQPGWWAYPQESDEPPIGGLPGIGETNAGFDIPGFGEWRIPLGSYPEVQSPWGLWDVSGAAAEWLEWVTPFSPVPSERGYDGASAGGLSTFIEAFDHIDGMQSLRPSGVNLNIGLRVASAVPGPHASVLVIGVMMCGSFRRRRECRSRE
jgi:formylglycine-generating enzyme required for sulfatase activity